MPLNKINQILQAIVNALSLQFTQYPSTVALSQTNLI